jgi:Ca2+-transporting ATPase
MRDAEHAFAFHAESIEAVSDHLGSDPRGGLSEQEAGQRLKQDGPNALRKAQQQRAWQILIDQFKSMVIIVLVIAGAVAFISQQWAEGIAIAAVLIVNAAIGFVTEWKAVRSMEALQAMRSDTIRVRRDGAEAEIDTEHLVPGDVVVLDSGDMAPADIRLLESNSLQVNESALTGESVPVQKQIAGVPADAPLAERTSMLYRGTTITRGSGEGIVVATGMRTELGRISALTESAEKETTPLQKRLNRLGRHLAWITLAIAAIIAGIGVFVGQDPRKMIETAIALGVAAIPEGLPIVATIALARGMQLMARRNALVKKLPAVETLGATRVIFTDKTGTLTENRMTLRRIVTPAGTATLDEEGGAAEEGDPLLRRIVEVGVLCNNASLGINREEGPSKQDTEQGDPTETALLRAGLFFDIRREVLLEAKPERREVPFDAERMMMATYHQGPDGLEVAVKGAPDRVLDACERLADQGLAKDRQLDEGARREWHARAEQLAGEGLRVLAAADKIVADDSEAPYRGLRFLGLYGLLDPPRGDVRTAIEECRSAGIRVIMLTGDQPATAKAIAEQTGITADASARVIHGKDLKNPEHMDEGERRRLLETDLFARVSPEQKLHLVRLMQSAGYTVAMTGDGVNDAPALKKADIGVAMGIRGTDAAREVADMILQDDAFATIVAAVRHGRIIFNNIRQSVMFMLCTNVAEVIAVALAAVAGGFSQFPIPLLPLQILYLNVVTDIFPALALGMGKGEPGIMARKPRPRSESVLTPQHWQAIAGWSGLLAACVLGALTLAFYGLGFEPGRAVTISFLTLAFGKLWFVFNLRSPGTRLLDNDIVNNPYIGGSIVLCIVLLMLAIYLPGLSDVLRTEPPGWQGWGMLLPISMIPFLWGQARRAVQAKRRHQS